MSGAGEARAPAPLVLLVDDEFAILEAVAELLRLEGYRVVMAGDGREALQALAVELPAVALVDVMMPGMGGIALIENMHDEPRYRDVPVVLMTAAWGAVPPTVAARVEILAKPFHIDVLLDAVRRAEAQHTPVSRER
ncbi:MAG: response regulator [Polyangiaceae bacterium]